jgi:hypothetical protein
VTLRARWVMLRARWVTLRARWVTLRARWVPFAGGRGGSPRQFIRQSSLPVAFQWSGNPTMAPAASKGEASKGFLSIVIPDVRSSVEIQSAVRLSTSACGGGDAASAAFRSPLSASPEQLSELSRSASCGANANERCVFSSHRTKATAH